MAVDKAVYHCTPYFKAMYSTILIISAWITAGDARDIPHTGPCHSSTDLAEWTKLGHFIPSSAFCSLCT